MSQRGRLPEKTRKRIEEFFESGMLDQREIAAKLAEEGVKLGKGNPVQVIAGMLTLWKRKLSGDGAGFTPRPPGIETQPRRVLPAARILPTEGPVSPAAVTPVHAETGPKIEPAEDLRGEYNWSSPGTPAPGGIAFGNRLVELHIRRIGPTNDGFLGTEPESLSPHALGVKYGSGVYRLWRMVNGVRVADTEESIGSNYGPPKYPKNGTPAGTLPRLRPLGEGGEESDREFSRRRPSEDLSDTAGTIRALTDAIRPQPGPQDKLVERAVEALVDRSTGGGDKDTLTDFIKAQVAKAEQDRLNAEAKHALDRQSWKDEVAQREREAEQKHTREMERMQREFDYRKSEAERLAAEKDKRDAEYRQFVEKMDSDREARYLKQIEETQAMVGSLQTGLTAELEKEREHQAALTKLREEQLAMEKKKNDELFTLQRTNLEAQIALQRTSMETTTALQMKLATSGEDKTWETICAFLKDTMVKVDAKAGQILETKQLEALIKIVGPDHAQQLAMSFLKNGGMDISKFLSGGARGATPATTSAPGPAASAPGVDGRPVSDAPEPKSAGEGASMNGIIAQVTQTPFFRDLLDIWAGQLRMKRSPYLFANQMAGFMVEDRRVELFYNYMASKPWSEFFSEIKEKVDAKLMPHFELPTAEQFFDDVVSLIAQRIEKDHTDRGIVPSSIETPAPEGSQT